MAEYLKPLPYPDADTKPYWDYAKRHELRMQSCADCGEVRFPPRSMCPSCHSMRDEWVPMCGTGTIYSWIVVHPPVLPAFAEEAPTCRGRFLLKTGSVAAPRPANPARSRRPYAWRSCISRPRPRTVTDRSHSSQTSVI